MKTEMMKSVSQALIQRMVERDSAGWPPNCAVFAYQPVRPQKRESYNKNQDSIKKK